MAASVGIVTDSTCYLPRGWAQARGIGVVPVQVIISGRPFDETDDDQADRVAEALRGWAPVTTSRPSPERFLRAFTAAADAGHDAVVVATLSALMSATCESALLAARESPIPVRVVDSRSIAMGLGFAVLAGAQAATDGQDLDAVAAVVEARARAAAVMFYGDTLEYLRRGGRVSATRAAVGQALQVKPLLHVHAGKVEPLERVPPSSWAARTPTPTRTWPSRSSRLRSIGGQTRTASASSANTRARSRPDASRTVGPSKP